MTKATEYLFQKISRLNVCFECSLTEESSVTPSLFPYQCTIEDLPKNVFKSSDRSPEGALIYLYVVQYEIPRLAQ